VFSFFVTDSTTQPNSRKSNTLSLIGSKALVREFKVCVYFLSTIPIWIMMKLISGLRVKLVIHIT